MTQQQTKAGSPDATNRTPQYGSDLVVDMLNALGIEYAAFNPGATFKWIHDSIVNYGGDRMPQSILCCHEEISVAIAHGYAKAKLKPMAAIVHNIVGLQHASMAIFNAWCDRSPVLVMGGTGPLDVTTRRPWIDWIHTSIDQAAIIRNYTKWDDQPHTAAGIPETMIRGYQIAANEPAGPVYLCFDADLQANPLAAPVPLPDVSRYAWPSRIQADLDGLWRLAELLVNAERPLIIAEYVGRNPAGFTALTELAELAAIPVVDKFSRHNFPTSSPMDLTGAGQSVLDHADVIVTMDLVDPFGAVNARQKADHKSKPIVRPETKLVNLSMGDLGTKSWAHNFHRTQAFDLNLNGDTAIVLPQLVKFCRELIEKNDAARKKVQQRYERVKEEHEVLRAGFKATANERWSSSPISLPRLATEIWDATRDRNIVITAGNLNGWTRRVMDLDKPNQSLGPSAGGGLGYQYGASLGAALAYRGTDVFPINIQSDGDLLFTPSALWTAAHHQIPFLTVVFNNRSYFNSEEHAMEVARDRSRPLERAPIGTAITDPNISFADLARTFNLYGEGPIEDPDQIGPALRRAVEAVDQGVAAVVDVVCEAR